LGIYDKDAVDVHILIGQRIYRDRAESGSRKKVAELTWKLHKLIYITIQE